jgi:hypothetical protein
VVYTRTSRLAEAWVREGLVASVLILVAGFSLGDSSSRGIFFRRISKVIQINEIQKKAVEFARECVNLQRAKILENGSDIKGSYRILKKRWSYFIRKVYETDPLICPKCLGEMWFDKLNTRTRSINSGSW